MPARARCVWSKSEFARQTCSVPIDRAGHKQIVMSNRKTLRYCIDGNVSTPDEGRRSGYTVNPYLL